MELTIANVGIRKDGDGRYCINDLHRAAGGEDKHRPAYWMKNQSFRDLVSELEIDGFPSFESKQGLGTFVCKELVYAYAMWISPVFHLHVIRTFDAIATIQFSAPQIPQTLPEALRLAADLADKVETQNRQMIEMKPKVDALDRLSGADGSLCLSDAAKALQFQPRKFMEDLHSMGWIHRRSDQGNFIAYQDKIKAGYLVHKIMVIPLENGEERIKEQVRVTPKGMAKLALHFSGTSNAGGR